VSGPEAPDPPGRLGEPIPAPQLLAYLSGLEAWLAHRRTELDRLDQAAQASPASESYTDDVLLALTMWQAIRTRTDGGPSPTSVPGSSWTTKAAIPVRTSSGRGTCPSGRLPRS